MTKPRKRLKEIASIYIKVMNFRILNSIDIEKIIEEEGLQYKEMEDFVTINPYPKPEEMPRIIEIANSRGISKEPMKQLYHKDLLEKLYHNIFDENKIIEIGKEMNDIKVTGPNDEEKMKQLFIFTNLTIFQIILEYNYNKNYLNRQFNKMNIFRFTKLINALWQQNNEKTDETRKIVKEINQEREKADEVEKKQCSRCKKMKENNEFENDRRQCNECINKRREYYNNNKDKFHEWYQTRYQNHCEKILEVNNEYKKQEYECIVCQQIVKTYKKSEHERTKKHLHNINNPDNPKLFKKQRDKQLEKENKETEITPKI